jgi:hypothetical protein
MVTRRDAILGVLIAPLITGCREAFGPLMDKPSFLQNADGSFSFLVTSDPHNRTATLNHCIQVGNLMRTYPNLDCFVLGDNASDGGTALQFQYTHKTWGDLYPRILPAMGNHDCKVDPTGTAYYDYYNGVGQRFGKAGERFKGFYTKDFGNWHIVVLNSEKRTVEQQTWLAADLTKNAGKHIIGMWHKPMYASPSATIIPLPNAIRPFWKEFQRVGAEAAFCGHIHRYERFAKLRADGTPGTNGMRQFMIGLGGAGSLMAPELGIHRYSEAHFWDTWGLMKVDLFPNSYSWHCIDIAGRVRDSGTQVCRKQLA